MKKTTLKLAILMFLGGFQQFAMAQNNIIDEVIWVVGEEAILRSDVENQKLQMQYQEEKIDGDPNCVLPEQMAIQKLFLHQAKLDSVVVSESQINSAVERRINYMISQIGSKEKLEEYFNKPLAQVRNESYEPTRNQMLVEEMQKKLIGDIKITPAEVRKYYKNLKADSIPMVPASIEVQIITNNPVIPQSEIDRVKDRLRSFGERITSGESQFSTLARLYSEDTESAKRGGELGFMGRGQLVPAFANAAFALTDPKKVSRVIETEYGFHLIQLIEKRGELANFRHILLKPQVSLDAENKAIQRLDSILTFIHDGKFSFEEACRFSYDTDTKMNNGLMTNANTGTAKFELQQLPSEIAKKAENMSVGEISKPFVMLNTKTNREICAIIKIKEKTPSHKANLADDYQTLKAVVENKQKNEIIHNWILKKQRETYVRIDPKWKNCTFQYPGWGQK
ncbi:MAG: PpiC-type peptidyl-prolyl cis-trans isomerase [Bacteroidetes bacterium]|jgi:peptidyl-prolyl cis-trans isomerase SurA|nr:PpiC-type peptidyl-prolyl cis-trans isomerase [Bacteroidota bacterium]